MSATTWFNEFRTPHDIDMMTSFERGLLIREFDYTYPIWTSDVSRVNIGYDQKRQGTSCSGTNRAGR